MKQVVEFMTMLLPFLKRKDPREMIEFSDLLKGQYSYLREVLEKFQQDYFNLSEIVRQMNQEIIVLNKQLQEALAIQCTDNQCNKRISSQ